jgi:hypothetical protein
MTKEFFAEYLKKENSKKKQVNLCWSFSYVPAEKLHKFLSLLCAKWSSHVPVNIIVIHLQKDILLYFFHK